MISNISRLAFGLCGFMVLLVACSSSGNKGNGDAGNGSSADTEKTCNPFTTPVCDQGQTCCWNGDRGICKDPKACSSTFQLQCLLPSHCSSGERCCGTFSPWFTDHAQEDAGELAKVDASVQFDSEETAIAHCSKSCAAPSVPLCRTNAECPKGTACLSPAEGGNTALISVAAEAIAYCGLPDGGVP